MRNLWLKGNLHTHTNRSDGDSDPEEVCRYYADRGYDFLSITDHNRYFGPEDLSPDAHPSLGQASAHGLGSFDRLLVIPGSEISTTSDDEPTTPLHVNGLGITGLPAVERGPTKAATLQNCIDAVVAAGGIAQINHPNFGYAFDHSDMIRTRGARLLEVYNGHPLVFNNGDEDHISVEEMWDHLLTAGALIYGTAVDDSHHFTGEFGPQRANPSRGWIRARVRTRVPTAREVLRALAVGDFYASNGVELEDVFVDAWTLHVVVRSAEPGEFVTQFIGDGGEVVDESREAHSTFNLREAGGRTYIRAKVIARDGSCAWCQPRLIPKFWRTRT